ncbi:MAG: histidine kinase [Ferruginibacter sp.]
MHKYLLTILLFLTATFGIAQGPSDSLKHLLDKDTVEDSTRVNRLISYANMLIYRQADSLMTYADEALRISEKIKWQYGIAKCTQLKGLAYSYGKNDQAMALEYYYKALDLNKTINSKSLEWNTYNNIALIFYTQKQYSKAVEYFKRCVVIVNEIADKKGFEQLLLNTGNAYYQSNKRDSAVQFFKQSLSTAEENKNFMITAGAMNALSVAYIDSKDYEKAGFYLSQSVTLSEKIGNMLLKAVSFIGLSEVKLNLNQTDSAIIYGKQGLEIAERVNSLQFRREAYRVLGAAYEKANDYKNAFINAQSYTNINDSMQSDESKQQVTRLEMQHEQDKKQAITNEKHAAEIKRQETIRNFLIGGASLIILVALLLLYSYKRRRDAEAKIKDSELKTQKIDTDMKVMRLQMNPHFIFNSLNSISDFIAKNNPQEADAYLTKFAKVMRMTLENSEQQVIPLADDLKMLEIYMQLEAKRLNNKFTYEINVDEKIDANNILVPPMIFQPFIENSIWHGIAQKEGVGKISLTINSRNEMLQCIIEDDGVGRLHATETKNNDEQKQSLGMKITKARIDILNKIKGSNASVQLIDKPLGLIAELNLPVETKF